MFSLDSRSLLGAKSYARLSSMQHATNATCDLSFFKLFSSRKTTKTKGK